MKFQKEIKAGLIALIAVTSFVALINFLKGNSFFQSGTLLYAIYDDVNGLETSRPVAINGLKVGKVEKIYFHSDRSGRLLVEMRVETDLDFSVNTVAMIDGAGLVSGPQINLVLSYKGRKVRDGDTIKGGLKPSAISSLFADVNLLKNKLQQVLTRMDIMLASFNSVLDQESQRQIKDLFKGINTTLQSVKTGTDAIAKTTQHFNRTTDAVTKIMADNSSGFNSSLHSIEEVADKVNKIDITQTFVKLNASLKSFNQVMNKIRSGEGTLGKLVASDDELYNRLSQISKELELLAQDLRLHPKRYLHFSIFGKKVQPYQKKPLEKEE
ncbi:MAG: MlaD family protein [Flavobacteriales bacterium Tduv]